MFNIVYGYSGKIYKWHGECNCLTVACSNKWFNYKAAAVDKSSHYKQTPGPVFIFTCTVNSRLSAESPGVTTVNINFFQQ